MPNRGYLPVVLLFIVLLAGCAGQAEQSPTASASPFPTITRSPTSTSTPTSTPTATPRPTLTPTPAPLFLTGAGDVAFCATGGDRRTAALLENLPGEIFVAGDVSNNEGTAAQYRDCFGPSWGRYKKRIHPAPGNHDFNSDPPGKAYFDYFGAAAGQRGKGWYSFDAGGWHVVVLNSNCNDVACGKDSPQVSWLRADLAAHPVKCTLAIWHHSRWSSGLAGSDGRMSAAYRVLYEAGAEVVISGHDHDYERLTLLNPEGTPDPQKGIRQFVVGTGGAALRPFIDILPESEAHLDGVYGVLSLALYPDHYDWRFLPVEDQAGADSGSALCH